MIKKSFEREELLSKVSDLQKSAKTMGFTSGVFDLLHPGHTSYLAKAKENCDLLIVGINSDKSVRKLKGAGRPVMKAADRAAVVSALESVDYVFIFDELNNNKSIELLKPDVYIKAGDYEPTQLSSAPIVESYGGKVLLIPLEEAHSTSSIINLIQSLKTDNYQSNTSKHTNRAVILDRDGTLCEHVEYLHEPERFKLIPGVIDGLKSFKEQGYKIVVITNQPGIGMGYFTKEDFFRVNKEMLKQLSSAGILVDKIYFCPHSKAEKCSCRKPEQELLKRAERELALDLKKSVIIGDSTSDIEFARRASCKSILVKTGVSGNDDLYNVEPDFVVDSILEASQLSN